MEGEIGFLRAPAIALNARARTSHKVAVCGGPPLISRQVVEKEGAASLLAMRAIDPSAAKDDLVRTVAAALDRLRLLKRKVIPPSPYSHSPPPPPSSRSANARRSSKSSAAKRASRTSSPSSSRTKILTPRTCGGSTLTSRTISSARSATARRRPSRPPPTST
jgi:hypothetical protein